MYYGTKGIMGLDYEQRIDFERLRRERVTKVKTELEKTDLGCLVLFDNHNKRYATATAVASPEVCNMGRYAILPRGGDLHIFGFGSRRPDPRRIEEAWLTGGSGDRHRAP